MRKRQSVWLSVLVIGLILSAMPHAAQETSSAERFLGVWSGTWQMEGAGSGGFELTLEKGKDNALAGRVSVTGEPTYKAVLKTVSIEGTKMSAKYDFPPDESMEVVLALTFEGNSGKGTWVARGKANGDEVASGALNLTKK